MDGHRYDNDNHKKDTGQSNADHSYAYKNEVSLSINNDDDQPAVITPTPSPRSYKIEDEIDVTDNVALTKNNGGHHNKKDEIRIGVDNPAFDNTNERKPTNASSPSNKTRPLSSFGHTNGDSSHAKSANGKNPDNNQLAGKLRMCSTLIYILHILLIKNLNISQKLLI